MTKQNTKIILHPGCLRHLTGAWHPESPNRYSSIESALKKAKLLTQENEITPTAASKETILLCHTATYVNILEKEMQKAQELQAFHGEYTLCTGDVQICPQSLKAAFLASGGAIAAVDAVMTKTADNAFCCIRPPGHHATSNAGMGFCILNNAAIAARYAQKKYGLQKILIADWDVHHGNGTQDIFYNDPSVFYFSTHQKGLYPGTGRESEKGEGNILNFPIEGGPGSRLKVLEAFHVALKAAAADFKPDMIIVSAGFDGHYADPLGGFDLTASDFTELTVLLKDLAENHCSGRLISLLEGGYNLEVLAECAVAHVTALKT